MPRDQRARHWPCSCSRLPSTSRTRGCRSLSPDRSPNDFPKVFPITLKLTHLATRLLILFLQYEMLYSKRLQRDAVALERMLQDQARQYQMSPENIEAINVHCHDIRRQIQDLSRAGEANREAQAQLAGEVNAYDSAVKTGNEALDVILTE